MNSTTERGYGARIGNAQKLVQALESFSNYQSVQPELSIAKLNEQIAAIHNLNNEVASKKQAYSLAVEHRLQILEKSPNSIKKVLSPINANVKAVYGRSAKEALLVAGIIEKMRGANIAKPKNPEVDTVSQSYQSYHSKTQFFADLIANISDFGSEYSLANSKLNVISLQALYNDAVAANNGVVDSHVQFSLTNSRRIEAYSNLSHSATRIKESVKAQYGTQSVEYRLIKSFFI
ncbi:hypothetical protein [Flavobacterium sp. GCM10027622]|uniref:hypothetical protein n=1 Tax=unclassified Flavobacterium TaxID=196869 RepID=UPI0036230A57